MDKGKMVEMLRADVCSVVFTKKDGTERKMNATLREASIPEDKRPKGTGKELSDDSPMIRAFDVDLGEFRSINSETVTHFGTFVGE